MYNNVPASRLVPFGLLHVAKSIDLCQNIFLLTAYQLGSRTVQKGYMLEGLIMNTAKEQKSNEKF